MTVETASGSVGVSQAGRARQHTRQVSRVVRGASRPPAPDVPAAVSPDTQGRQATGSCGVGGLAATGAEVSPVAAPLFSVDGDGMRG